MRVLIVDDHQLIREGVKRILHETPEITKVGEAEDGQQAMDALRKEKWDVVILDIKLVGRSGLDVLRDIKQEYPQLPVLILSMYPERQFAVRMIRAGASGYLAKTGASEELTTALYKIYRGGKYISPSVAEEIVDALQKEKVRSHSELTNREYEVFLHIASGESLSTIANEMNLSVKTISTYRANILDKMDLRNNAEIVQYAVNSQLIDKII